MKNFVASGLWKGERPLVEWPDGTSREMYSLGKIGDASLVPTLAAYAHAVLQFRLIVMGQKRPLKPKRTVFLSHSSADRQWCDAFVGALRALGRDVWYDERTIQPGILSEELTTQITKHDAFVLALSRNALNSEYVQQELRGRRGCSGKTTSPGSSRFESTTAPCRPTLTSLCVYVVQETAPSRQTRQPK